MHAHAHLKNAGKIGDTVANLKAAIEGETYEFTNMYPAMIKQAEAEGLCCGCRRWIFANQVEEIHANLYKKALENPAALPETDYYVCKVPGYTHECSRRCLPRVCVARAAAFSRSNANLECTDLPDHCLLFGLIGQMAQGSAADSWLRLIMRPVCAGKN